MKQVQMFPKKVNQLRVYSDFVHGFKRLRNYMFLGRIFLGGAWASARVWKKLLSIHVGRRTSFFLSFSLLPFCRRPEPCKHKVERKGKLEVMEAGARRRVDISAAVIPKDIADVTGRSSELGIDGRTLLFSNSIRKSTRIVNTADAKSR